MSLFEAACGPPPCRPDQPRPGHRIPQITSATPAGHPAIPGTDPWTSRRNVNGRKAALAVTFKIRASLSAAETVT